MKRIPILACVSFVWIAASAACAENATGGARTVSIKNVAFDQGERVQEIHLRVTGAFIVFARFPVDWNYQVGAPISGVASLDGEAAHGVAMPFTLTDFEHFAAIAPFGNGSPSIAGHLVLYRYDKSGRESERTVELKTESIVIDRSNQSSDPTLASVTPPARQESRPR